MVAGGNQQKSCCSNCTLAATYKACKHKCSRGGLGRSKSSGAGAFGPTCRISPSFSAAAAPPCAVCEGPGACMCMRMRAQVYACMTMVCMCMHAHDATWKRSAPGFALELDFLPVWHKLTYGASHRQCRHTQCWTLGRCAHLPGQVPPFHPLALSCSEL